jgi:hypothetical protein
MQIHHGGFVDVVSGIAGFQFHQVQHLVGVKAGFFLQFAYGGVSPGFSGLDFATGQRPAAPQLTHEENVSVLLANDGCAYFHV